MRLPKSLETLADHGIIEEVLRPLMSGKEAQIYLVVSKGEVCAAKIYKDAQTRSFKNRADYVEGRKVRNSRDQRAMTKGSKYGKSKDEDTWRSTEVDMIYRLQSAGVRVPTPHTFIDGVLVMELVKDPDGNPAPRLGDLHFTPEEATDIFHMLLGQVVRMLCAGVVHGDLSDFNVLLAWDGPVVIDFPQSIDAASNLNARSLLLRDIENLKRFHSRFVPGAGRRPYGEELWSLYESNRLTPETKLTGTFKGSTARVNTAAVLELIGDANRDEEFRRKNAGKAPARTASPIGRRREVVIEKPAARSPVSRGAGRGPGGPRDNRDGHNARSAPYRGGPGGPSRGGPARGGPPRGGPSRGGAPRSGFDRGGPPNRENSGPKRGDTVQNSSYVSPEARKAKRVSLTLKDGSSPSDSRRDQDSSGDRARNGARGPRGREARPQSGSEGSSRRRNRRPRASDQSGRAGDERRQGADAPRSSTASRTGPSSPVQENRPEEEARPRRRRRRRPGGGASSPRESEK